MKKLSIILFIPIIACLLLWGCSNDQSLLQSNFRTNMAPIIIPNDVIITSVTLNVYCSTPSNQLINIHRVTSDWDEVVVTWNNFGGAFDPAVEGSFVADNYHWLSADMTSLFNGWLNGTYDNFGLLLDQPEGDSPWAVFHSRELTTNHAYLDVCYVDDSGVETCEQTEVVADTYIGEIQPDANKGTVPVFYCGNLNGLKKQALLRFELEAEPQEGCSHTIGFWKTHAGFGPQDNEVSQYLPITLGTDGGVESFVVSDSVIAVDVLKMKTYGRNNNGITKLMAQLLGSKLSIADGASDFDIADAIADADAFLADHNWSDWKNLSKADKNDVLNLMSIFDDFNNGYIGPGHCDEFNPDHDYDYGDGGKKNN